jgi:hypothetical protein
LHKATNESIRLRRDRNVWVIDTFVDEEDGKVVSLLDQGFTRQE